MDNLFGKDFFSYPYDEKKVCYVHENDAPNYEYNHTDWEDEYSQNLDETPQFPQSPAGKKGSKSHPHPEQKSKSTKRCLFPAQKSDPCPKPQEVMTKNQVKPAQKSTCTPSPIISKPSMSSPESLQHCMSQTATRQELSQVKLPPLTNQIHENNVVPIYGKFQDENPYLLKSCPADNIVKVAQKIIGACSSQVIKENTIQLDDSDGPSGVKIGNLGIFSDSGIQALSRYCCIAKMQQDYKEEMAWLSLNPDKNTLRDSEIKYLCNIFEQSPHDPLRVIVSLDGHHVDFKSLSTLVGERYIDNFIINYCLKKTLQSKQIQEDSILCLPTEALSWLDNQVLEPVKTVIRKDLHQPHELKLILLPVHMANIPHWGLACVDLETLTVWYDDGLKVAPPAQLCNIIGRLVMLLGEMFPSINSFNSFMSSHLSASQYKRMHMPKQRIDGKTAGGGSCGMGVILLAQEIILGKKVPPHQISWSFEESNYFRKKLMLYMLM